MNEVDVFEQVETGKKELISAVNEIVQTFVDQMCRVAVRQDAPRTTSEEALIEIVESVSTSLSRTSRNTVLAAMARARIGM